MNRKRKAKENNAINVAVRKTKSKDDVLVTVKQEVQSDGDQGYKIDPIQQLKKSDIKQDILKEFMVIPGIGKSLSQDIYQLGINSLAELKLQHPDSMFEKLKSQPNGCTCRCVLYTFRCAVYYASVPIHLHDQELLKWWSWSDKNVDKFNLKKKFKYLF